MGRKWIRGLAFNYAGLFLVAASSLTCSLLLARSYDSQIVGRFHYTLTWLLVLGQTGTLGTHQAVMCYAAKNPKERKRIMGGAVMITGAVSAALFMGLELLAFTVVRYEYRIWVSLLGLTVSAHALNKLILGYLNGMGAMSVYAGVNVFRAVAFITCALVLERFHVNGQLFFLSCTMSELATCLMGMGGLLRGARIEFDTSWMKRLLSYGIRIMPAMISAELKTKGFVLIMKVFLTDSVLGVYSFAMLFVEGFYQLYITLRVNLNPRLAQSMETGKKLKGLVKGRINWMLRIAGPSMAALTVGGYHVLVLFLGKPEYGNGTAYLGASVIAIAVTGRMIICQTCISFAGFPQYESIAMILSSAFDVCCCFISIWIWGEAGMVIFSILSYLVSGMLTCCFLRACLKSSREYRNEC